MQCKLRLVHTHSARQHVAADQFNPSKLHLCLTGSTEGNAECCDDSRSCMHLSRICAHDTFIAVPHLLRKISKNKV